MKSLPSLLLFTPVAFSATLLKTRDVAQQQPQPPRTTAPIWQPPVASKFQIILYKNGGGGRRLNAANSLQPQDADIFDLDLFDTPKSTIDQLHRKGKKVICYFSAGSAENWRTDYKKFQAKDMGDKMRGWNREKWLDIRSPEVFEVMKTRMKLGADKGCDGVDADNVDAYGDESRRGGGFPQPLTTTDSINFIRNLSTEAHSLGMAMGLKNAESILPSVSRMVEFAVNEQCATYYGGCKSYEPFIRQGKPVFHIEYAIPAQNGTELVLKDEGGQFATYNTTELEKLYCLETGVGNRRWLSRDVAGRFSTVIKTMDLSSFVVYCDGSVVGSV